MFDVAAYIRAGIIHISPPKCPLPAESDRFIGKI